jgi:hypothetical protein
MSQGDYPDRKQLVMPTSRTADQHPGPEDQGTLPAEIIPGIEP